jgi:hypothetical protein
MINREHEHGGPRFATLVSSPFGTKFAAMVLLGVFVDYPVIRDGDADVEHDGEPDVGLKY